MEQSAAYREVNELCMAMQIQSKNGYLPFGIAHDHLIPAYTIRLCRQMERYETTHHIIHHNTDRQIDRD